MASRDAATPAKPTKRAVVSRRRPRKIGAVSLRYAARSAGVGGPASAARGAPVIASSSATRRPSFSRDRLVTRAGAGHAVAAGPMMRVYGWLAVLVVAGAQPSWALTAHLITAGALVNHAPGNDFRIGTPDDVVSADGLGIDDAGPNTHGAASYAFLNGVVPLGDNPDID